MIVKLLSSRLESGRLSTLHQNIVNLRANMKATLHFDLSDPDDRHEFDITTHARELMCVISKYKNVLRGITKHGLIDSVLTPEELAEKLSEEFHDILKEYDIPDDY